MPIAVLGFGPGSDGHTSTLAIVYFLLGVALTLYASYWTANRTRAAGEFYSGARGGGPLQNGLALAGDYMSGASFLGIAGLCALNGNDGMIYAVGCFVAWPLLLFLVGEPLRNMHRYTFADAVAFRLKRAPVRFASAIGGILTVLLYLVAQIVGSSELIALLFGIRYAVAEVIVGVAVMIYVFFGGMFGTTWTQVIKAVLLLSAVTLLAFAVLARFGFSPVGLQAAVSLQQGQTAHGGISSAPLEAVSLGLALMFGLLGLPHVLTRFFLVPDSRVARLSVLYATGVIGYFYCLIPVVGIGAAALLGGGGGSGARFAQAGAFSAGFGGGGNMVAPLLADFVGGPPFVGLVAAVAVATILAASTGLTLSGASSYSRDIYATVLRRGRAKEQEEIAAARKATIVLIICSCLLGLLFKGQNVAFLVGLAFAVACSANVPALLLSIFWKKFTTAAAVCSILTGTFLAVGMIFFGPAFWGEILGHRSPDGTPIGLLRLRNPAIVSMPAAFIVGWLVSLFTRDPPAEQLFLDEKLGSYLGAGSHGGWRARVP